MRNKNVYKKTTHRKAFARVLGIEPIKDQFIGEYKKHILKMETVLKEELNWSAQGGEIQHGDCLSDHLRDYLVYKNR